MESRSRSTYWPGVVISAGFLVLFLALRSNDFAGVDGALRCLSVFFDGDRFHGNNHMLYPFWVGLWAQANQLLGIRAENGIEFMYMTESMNAFAAATSVGFLYYLIASVSSTSAAVLGSLMFGLCHAVTLQATSADEPVIGLFFALLGLVILAWGIRRSNPAAMLAAGFAMSVALASYQTMGIVIAPALLMCLYWPVNPESAPMTAARRVLAAAAGSTIGVVVVYGWSYHLQGISLARMPARFVTLDGAPGVYSGPALIPGKVLHMPFGFIWWFFGAVPDDYEGLSRIVRHSHAALWVAFVLAGFALLGLMLWLAGRAWKNMTGSTRVSRSLLVGLVIFFTLPVWYWGSVNPKMFLLPLASLIFFLTVGWARGDLGPPLHRALTACLVLCLAIEAVRDIPPVIHDHRTPTPGLAYAAEIGRTIHPDDWVVADFDRISGLWMGFWGHKTKTLVLPASNPVEAAQWLEDAKAATGPGRGRLLFLNLLQTNRQAWDFLLGDRVKIPYEFLEPYRRSSTVLVAPKDAAFPTPLWQYVPPGQ